MVWIHPSRKSFFHTYTQTGGCTFHTRPRRWRSEGPCRTPGSSDSSVSAGSTWDICSRSLNPQSPSVCEAESASCPRASHPSRRSPLSPWWSMPLWVFLTIGRWTVIAFRWIYPDWGDKACIIVCLSWFHYSWTHVMLWTTSCVNSHAQVLHHTSISHCNNIPSMFQERQLWLFW